MDDTAQSPTSGVPVQESPIVQTSTPTKEQPQSAPVPSPQPQPQPPSPSGTPPTPKKGKMRLVILFGIILFVVIATAAYAIVWFSRSSLEIDNQVIEDSVLIKRVVLRHRAGGYFRIKSESVFPNSGIILIQTSILPPGIYENIPLVFDPNLTIIEPGQVLYGLLYAESDGLPGLTESDSFIKDIFGKVPITSFRAL